MSEEGTERKAIFWRKSKVVTCNYIPNSNLIATVTSPGHIVTNTYAPDRNVLLTKSNTRATDNTVISSVNYIVNTLGQRTGRAAVSAASSTPESTSWTYDALGQVETEDQPGTTTDRAFQYDHIGNRKKSANSLTLPATDNYTSNALNQYTAFTSGQLTSEPQYDFDGNMTHGPHPADPTIPALFLYDAENRLLEIRNATTGVTLQSNHYDAFHRLIRVTALHNGQSTTEHILWKGWTLVSRYVSNGGSLSETFHYTWGTDLSGSEQGAGGVGGLLAITRVPVTGNASTRHPLYDGNGNITALVTADGSLSASYQYDAFGNSLSSTDNDGSGWVNHNIHGFSTKPTFGHQGLHYYGYRWYNLILGRWLNRDPIEENGGLNLYGFVGNDTLNMVDLYGLTACCCADSVDIKNIQQLSKIKYAGTDPLMEFIHRTFEGHSFDAEINLKYKWEYSEDEAKCDCSMQWWEWSNVENSRA